jgi:hypothetical protein
MTSVLIKDEILNNPNTQTWTLDFLDETIPAHEFLRRRIYEEVQSHNSQPHEKYSGLIQPKLEQNLNNKKLDWEAQYQTALHAFSSNSLIMLWNNQQIEDLNQMLELRAGCEVTFLKLVPLVGG